MFFNIRNKSNCFGGSQNKLHEVYTCEEQIEQTVQRPIWSDFLQVAHSIQSWKWLGLWVPILLIVFYWVDDNIIKDIWFVLIA